MKFDFTPILLLLPITAQACDMAVIWTKNWSEAGLRRYQVKLVTNPRNDDHLGIYGQGVWEGSVPASNTQWYWDQGSGDFVVDTSFQEGTLGYKYVHLRASSDHISD
jgi:hypothetical protein